MRCLPAGRGTPLDSPGLCEKKKGDGDESWREYVEEKEERRGGGCYIEN